MDPSTRTFSTSECSICLTSINEQTQVPHEQPKRLNCGHVFHTECIEEWLEIKPDCAYCRTPVLLPPLVAAEPIPDIPYPAPTESETPVVDSVRLIEDIRERIETARLVRKVDLNENTEVARVARSVNAFGSMIFGFNCFS